MTLRRLYLALAIVSLAPIWSAHYLPTADGPSHVYNSWVLRELVLGHRGVVTEWYAVDWRPYPNWSGHAVLALLMSVFPPLIAEKLLVSGIVLLFLYAMWRYAGACALTDDVEASRAVAFIAFPFAYHLLLQMGFYNFAIGAALYFLVLAAWWEGRLVGATLLLLACYFSHALPAMLAVASIALLALLTRRWRGLLVVLPVLPLLAWFLHVRGATLASAHVPAFGLFDYLRRMWVVLTFDVQQAKLGFTLSSILALLIVMTFLRRRWKWTEGDAFLLVTLLLVVLYARAPAASSGGTMIMERMALFVALSPLVWIAPRLPPRAGAAMVILLTILSLVYTGYLVRRYRGLSRRVTELVRSADALGRDAAVLPLIRDVRPPRGAFVPVLMHAFDYAAVEKHDVDIANYEAGSGYFPIRFRDGVAAPAIETIGVHAGDVDIAPYIGNVPYVFTWHVPDDAPVVEQLRKSHAAIGGSDGGVVYR